MNWVDENVDESWIPSNTIIMDRNNALPPSSDSGITASAVVSFYDIASARWKAQQQQLKLEAQRLEDDRKRKLDEERRRHDDMFKKVRQFPSSAEKEYSSAHARAVERPTWISRTGGSSTVSFFPCCGQLALLSDGSWYSERPCHADPSTVHRGGLLNLRSSRSQARQAASIATWTCCGGVCVQPASAPEMFVLLVTPCKKNEESRKRARSSSSSENS
jgi:hypothetical protein